MTASGAAWAQPPEAPATSIKHGVSLVRGHRTPYRVETGETVLRTADGAAGVTMFSVSYIDEHAPPATRPVTFIYNGGPGGATWPLREAVSPKMIVAAKTAPGYAFANNPDSLMDVSDLVFIDAPGTGYSRLLTEAGKTEFLGVEEDGRAFSTCIERWLDAHGRRRSPKFILGESYGGIRTGQIMKVLGARAQPIHFTGVILISPAVDPLEHGRTGLSDAAATLPTQAAVAHLYGRGAYVRKALEQVAAQARVFANGPYQAALDRIGQLTPDERGRLAEQVSAYIGFPKDAVLAANLAVPEHQFRDELLADQGQVLGEDGRVHHAPFKPGESDLIDVAKGYDLQAAIEGLLTDELGYRPFGRYSRDPTEIGRHWNSKVTSEPYKLQDILKAETRARPHFRIFLAGGYYDLIVPYSLPLNSLESVGLPPRRFIHRLYPTGHPVLNDAAARPHATDEIRTFYRAA
jgi:carboxypeptidase C (cathepsin A)